MSRQILTRAIEKLGVSAQLGILQEDATGLAIAASEVFSICNEETINHLAEEMASVSIMMEQMTLVFPNISGKVAKYRSEKLQKLEMRINSGDFESPPQNLNQGTQLEIEFPD